MECESEIGSTTWTRRCTIVWTLVLCFAAAGFVHDMLPAWYWYTAGSPSIMKVTCDVDTATTDLPSSSCLNGTWVWDERPAVMCHFADPTASWCPNGSAGWVWTPRSLSQASDTLGPCLQNKRVAFVGDAATYDQLVSIACMLPEATALHSSSRSRFFFSEQNNVTATFIALSSLLKDNHEQIAERLLDYDVLVVGIFDLWWGVHADGKGAVDKDRARVWQMVTDMIPLLETRMADRTIVWRSSTPPPCLKTTERMRAQLKQLNIELLRALSTHNRTTSLYLDVTDATNEWIEHIENQSVFRNCSHWCTPGIPDMWNGELANVLCHACSPRRTPLTPPMFPKSSPPERAVVQFLLARGPPQLPFYSLKWSMNAESSFMQRKVLLYMDMKAGLQIPMNWTEFPSQSRTFRMKLHSLAPMMSILGTVYNNRSLSASVRHEAANMTKLMCLDWIEHNSVIEESPDMCWHDMGTGLRASSLAFGLSLVLAEGLLSPQEFATWLRSLRQHAAWLMDNANYRFHHNHGIFEDMGLFVLSRDLCMLPEAFLWEQRSRERLLENFGACVNWDEGIWLEHSPMYQKMMPMVIHMIRAIGLGSDEFARLEQLMRKNMQWFLLPDGNPVALGDTTPGPYHEAIGGPRTVVNDTLQVFWRVGIGVARASPYSVLYFTSWFHSKGHKHLDDLSISLFEFGERLLVQPGVYGYVTGPTTKYRVYAQSAAGSNGLQVDNDMRLSEDEVFYGSGLVGSGWRERRSPSDPPSFALEGWNPRILRHKGVRHHRTIYYHPMHTLVVVDRVESTVRHRYTRYLHFGPAVTLQPTDNPQIFGMKIVGRNDTHLPCVVESSKDPIQTSQVRGRRDPTVQGFVFPTGLKPLVPIDTLVMTRTTTSANFVVWFDLEGTRAPRVRLAHVTIDKKGRRTELFWTDGQRVLLERQGTQFYITEE